MTDLILSPLGHTWILDLDGTVVKHNGYKDDKGDTFLYGAANFIANLPAEDMIVFITSRSDKYREDIEHFLSKNGIRFDHIICNAPYGERIVVNDRKPSGLPTALSVNVLRDSEWDVRYEINEEI